MENCEDMILKRQERESDDCKNCEYASAEKCKNQCMEIHYIYNPNLRR